MKKNKLEIQTLEFVSKELKRYITIFQTQKQKIDKKLIVKKLLRRMEK